MTFNLPPPDLQVSFSLQLMEARAEFLQDALKATVGSLNIVEVDRQLATYAPKPGITLLASHGLRGELVFPVPLILASNPKLLGYYRLLLGYSQKLFYATGFGRFKGMEERGRIPPRHASELGSICEHLGM